VRARTGHLLWLHWIPAFPAAPWRHLGPEVRPLCLAARENRYAPFSRGALPWSPHVDPLSRPASAISSFVHLPLTSSILSVYNKAQFDRRNPSKPIVSDTIKSTIQTPSLPDSQCKTAGPKRLTGPRSGCQAADSSPAIDDRSTFLAANDVSLAIPEVVRALCALFQRSRPNFRAF
jgi:hypothetical protein